MPDLVEMDPMRSPASGTIDLCNLCKSGFIVRRLTMANSSHYGVTGSMRWSWVRLSLFEERTVQSHKRREPVMREKLRFLGLDVHAETIAVAIAEPDGEVRSLGTIANREESIRKFIRKLGSPEQLRACYEAGPTGFVLYWQLTQLGVECAVVAPSWFRRSPEIGSRQTGGTR
jgi:hypothetical protein